MLKVDLSVFGVILVSFFLGNCLNIQMEKHLFNVINKNDRI